MTTKNHLHHVRHPIRVPIPDVRDPGVPELPRGHQVPRGQADAGQGGAVQTTQVQAGLPHHHPHHRVRVRYRIQKIKSGRT